MSQLKTMLRINHRPRRPKCIRLRVTINIGLFDKELWRCGNICNGPLKHKIVLFVDHILNIKMKVILAMCLVIGIGADDNLQEKCNKIYDSIPNSFYTNIEINFRFVQSGTSQIIEYVQGVRETDTGSDNALLELYSGFQYDLLLVYGLNFHKIRRFYSHRLQEEIRGDRISADE